MLYYLFFVSFLEGFDENRIDLGASLALLQPWVSQTLVQCQAITGEKEEDLFKDLS